MYVLSGVTPTITLERNANKRESPKVNMPSAPVSDITLDKWSPTTHAVTETINPDMGPDAPISISAFLVMMGDFILINAPNVPNPTGAGIKYGRVALVPCLLEAM